MKSFLKIFIATLFGFCFQNKNIAQCWNNGNLTTYNQDGWKSATVLTDDNLKTLYGSDFEIGSQSGFFVLFTTEVMLFPFLPQITSHLAAGIYFCRLSMDGFSELKKMVSVK